MKANTISYLFASLSITLFIFSQADAQPGVTAKENLDQLLKTRSCRGCDLSGVNFNRMDLVGVDLEGADLTMAKFYLANLSEANLRGAILSGAIFGGADLGDADLSGADLRGVSLDNAYLGGARIDGDFVSTSQYEELGVTEVQRQVFVADQNQPKKIPSQNELRVGERQDLSEPPPVPPAPVAKKTMVEDQAPPSIKDQELPPEMADMPAAAAKAPEVKKVQPIQAAIVDEEKEQKALGGIAPETGNDKMEVADTKSYGLGQQGAKPELDPAQETEQEGIGQGLSQDPKSAPTAELVGEELIEEDLLPEVEETATAMGAAAANASELAEDKKKRDNLDKLFDTNRCYGCDLSGLDLSGKDFEKADLEKANLSGAILEKADLEKANLKGAKLVGTNLRGSDLEKADFYNADLTDADLSGAKKKKTMFDGAILDGTRGIEDAEQK